MTPGLYLQTILIFTEFSNWNAALHAVPIKIHDSDHFQHKCLYNNLSLAHPSGSLPFCIIIDNMSTSLNVQDYYLLVNDQEGGRAASY